MKISREHVRDLVLPPWEPLSVLVDFVRQAKVCESPLAIVRWRRAVVGEARLP